MEDVFPYNPEEIIRKTPRKDRVPFVGRLKLVRGAEARAILREALLPVYTPRYLYGMVRPPSTIYYRIYRKGDEYAVFLLYEWPDQYIPPHKYDYEPVIMILDKSLGIKKVYTDGFHYYIHGETPPPLTSAKPYIEINAPWRSMVVKWSRPGDDEVMVFPADEVKGSIAPTRIKYLSDKTIQALRSRRENPLSVNERLIRNPFSVEYAKHWETFHEPTPEELARDIAKNYGLTRLDLLAAKAKLAIKTLADKARAFIEALEHTVKEKIREKEYEHAHQY